MSGGAAFDHDGRRPRLTSPYNVNCGTTRMPPPASSRERFIFPASSSKIRRWTSFPASRSVSPSSSSTPTPASTTRPGPISATVRPETWTAARDTRWTTRRMSIAGELPRNDAVGVEHALHALHRREDAREVGDVAELEREAERGDPILPGAGRGRDDVHVLVAQDRGHVL